MWWERQLWLYVQLQTLYTPRPRCFTAVVSRLGQSTCLHIVCVSIPSQICRHKTHYSSSLELWILGKWLQSYMLYLTSPCSSVIHSKELNHLVWGMGHLILTQVYVNRHKSCFISFVFKSIQQRIQRQDTTRRRHVSGYELTFPRLCTNIRVLNITRHRWWREMVVLQTFSCLSGIRSTVCQRKYFSL